jgi:hypothetical protein
MKIMGYEMLSLASSWRAEEGRMTENIKDQNLTFVSLINRLLSKKGTRVGFIRPQKHIGGVVVALSSWLALLATSEHSEL